MSNNIISKNVNSAFADRKSKTMVSRYVAGLETDPLSYADAVLAMNVIVESGQSFSVKGYGGVGDGVANDTIAINAALAAANAVQGSVFFPTGTYLTDGDHVIGDKVAVYGEGGGSIISLRNNRNVSIFKCIVSGHSPRIFNLGIVGNRANQTTGHGIHFNSTVDAIVQNVIIDNVKESCILMTGTGSHSTIFKVHGSLSNRFIEVDASSSDHVFADTCGESMDDIGYLNKAFGCRFYSAHSFACRVGFFQSGGGRTAITDSLFGLNNEQGMFLEATQDIHVRGCYVFENSQSGVDLFSAILLNNNTTDCIITNNTIYDDQVTKTQHCGLELNAGCIRNILKHNVIRDIVTQAYCIVEADNDFENTLADARTQQFEFAVLRNTNGDAGLWTNITNNVLDEQQVSTPLLDGLGVNNAFYIGANFPYLAMELNILTAIDLGAGSIAIEYWNGVVWQPIRVMHTLTVYPKLSTANVILANAERVRIRHEEPSDWAVRSLDGLNRYWIRVIVTGVITTLPVTDNVAIFKEGVSDGELFVELNAHENIYEVQDVLGRTSADGAILAGPNTGINKQNIHLNNGSFDGFGFVVQTPPDIDTSKPVFYFVTYQASTNNTNPWESQMFLAEKKEGSLSDGTLPEQSAISIHNLSNDDNIVKIFSETFNYETLKQGDPVQVSVNRDARAGNGNDLLNGDIDPGVVTLVYRRWK